MSPRSAVLASTLQPHHFSRILIHSTLAASPIAFTCQLAEEHARGIVAAPIAVAHCDAATAVSRCAGRALSRACRQWLCSSWPSGHRHARSQLQPARHFTQRHCSHSIPSICAVRVRMLPPRSRHGWRDRSTCTTPTTCDCDPSLLSWHQNQTANSMRQILQMVNHSSLHRGKATHLCGRTMRLATHTRSVLSCFVVLLVVQTVAA